MERTSRQIRRTSPRAALAAGLCAAGLALALSAEPGAAAETCATRAGQCDAICAARPPVRPYTSRYDRCAESCEPRFQQCLRTGLWVHIEDERAGWRERVDRF